MPARKQRKPPKIGSVFEKSHKENTYKMTVVVTPSGIGYKVNAEVFNSPSAAAKLITGSERNGWVWWGIEPR